jgi:protein disulfide-isomerase A6
VRVPLPYTYLARTLTEIACSLSTILSKRTLAGEKLDEIKTKANVLAAFAKKKMEEIPEEIEELVEEVKHHEL